MNTMRYALAVMAFVPAAAFAKNKMAILQVDNSRHLAAVSTGDEHLQTWQSLIATAKDGRQCSLTVKSVRKANAIVDTSTCEFATQLRSGQTLELSLIDNEAAPQIATATATVMTAPATVSAAAAPEAQTTTTYQPRPKKSGVNISALAMVDTANKISASYSNHDPDATYNMSTGLGFMLDFSTLNPGTVGFYGNLGFELPHAINSVDQGGGTVSFNENKPQFSMVLMGVGGNISFNENFYMLAGLNFSVPHMSNSDHLSLRGKPGFETGVGFHISQFNGQLVYRYLAMDGSIAGNGEEPGLSADYKSSGLLLRAGAMF